MTTNHTEEAQELLDSRLAVYGERVSNMERVAKVFSGILGTEVRPDQVPLLMAGYKTVRASITPDYEDNVKDIEGYALMFREIIGDDMIAAVNTDEYVLEKKRREAEEIAKLVDPPEPEFTCSGCGRTLLFGALPRKHAPDCKVAELNRHTNAYNGRYDEGAQVGQLLKEVPSYQPGPNVTPQHLMEVYREQLKNIFQRAWKEEWVVNPQEKFAEAAAREAVEFFWITFKKNEELQGYVNFHKPL